MSMVAITLCVAITTFILQEGITNIIHGIIFRFLSKVKIGDRINIVVDSVSYTGTVSKEQFVILLLMIFKLILKLLYPIIKLI